MSLNYDLTKIENREEVCYNYTDERLNQVTERIIFATMSAGIGTLTKANAAEFYARACVWHNLITASKQGPGFTAVDVERHIGLKTNVTNETRSKWLSTLKRYIERELNVIRNNVEREKELV